MLIGLMRGMCLTNDDAVFKRMEKKYILPQCALGDKCGDHVDRFRVGMRFWANGTDWRTFVRNTRTHSCGITTGRSGRDASANGHSAIGRRTSALGAVQTTTPRATFGFVPLSARLGFGRGGGGAHPFTEGATLVVAVLHEFAH